MSWSPRSPTTTAATPSSTSTPKTGSAPVPFLRWFRYWLGARGRERVGRARSAAERSSYGLSRCGLLVVRTRQGGAARPQGRLLSGHAPEVGVDLACDVTLEAADDLEFREAFVGAAGDVVPGAGVEAHAAEDDAPEGVVGLAVTGAVEALPGDLP